MLMLIWINVFLSLIILPNGAQGEGHLATQTISSNDYCRMVKGQKAAKIMGLIAPNLFYETERPGSNSKYSYGANFSLISSYQNFLEIRRQNLECSQYRGLERVSALTTYGKESLRSKPLKLKWEILQKAVERVRILSNQAQQQLESRSINLEKYFSLKKKFFELEALENQVQMEWENLSKTELPEKFSLQEIFSLEREGQATLSKIQMIRDMDLSVEWGKSVPKDGNRKLEEEFLEFKVVIPLAALGSLFTHKSSLGHFDTWNRRRPDHPVLKFKAMVSQLQDNLVTHKNHLKELESLFTPEILNIFQRNLGQVESEQESERSQKLWLDNVVLFSEYVYAKSYNEELERFLNYATMD